MAKRPGMGRGKERMAEAKELHRKRQERWAEAPAAAAAQQQQPPPPPPLDPPPAPLTPTRKEQRLVAPVSKKRPPSRAQQLLQQQHQREQRPGKEYEFTLGTLGDGYTGTLCAVYVNGPKLELR